VYRSIVHSETWEPVLGVATETNMNQLCPSVLGVDSTPAHFGFKISTLFSSCLRSLNMASFWLRNKTKQQRLNTCVYIFYAAGTAGSDRTLAALSVFMKCGCFSRDENHSKTGLRKSSRVDRPHGPARPDTMPRRRPLPSLVDGARGSLQRC